MNSIILNKSVEHGFCGKSLGKKVKELLEDNGLSPYRELFCRIFCPDFSHNREAEYIHHSVSGEKLD